MKGVLFPPQPPDAPGSELSAGSVAGRAVRPVFEAECFFRLDLVLEGHVPAEAAMRNRLKEESDFRNERDVVPAAIRAGPNRRFFFNFFWKVGTLHRDAEVESFWSF
jgi:hypothetical protein